MEVKLLDTVQCQKRDEGVDTLFKIDRMGLAIG